MLPSLRGCQERQTRTPTVQQVPKSNRKMRLDLEPAGSTETFFVIRPHAITPKGLAVSL